MPDYLCSQCRQPCKPQMHYVGVVADCPNGCVEAPLLVWDDEICATHHEWQCRQDMLDNCQFGSYRPITEAEERDLADELAADEQADWSRSQIARFRGDHQ